MLDKAKTRVETEFKEDRLLQARLLAAIRDTYRALELFEQSVELCKKTYDIARSVGPEHPHTLEEMHYLAGGYWDLLRLDQSIPLFEETVSLHRKVFGRIIPRRCV